MDLQLHLRVLWRFRALILCGLLIAMGLALLSFVRVEFSGGQPVLKYRQAELWESSAIVFVTERGFPLGQLSPQLELKPADPRRNPEPFVPRFADTGRLASLATMYSYFADSDEMREVVEREGPLPGGLSITPVQAGDGSTLPLIRVSGVAQTPRAAAFTAERGTSALRTYLKEKQVEGQVPNDQRVLLSILREADPTRAELVAPRKKTRPIVVFLTVMLAFFGLAFVLENLRPRVRLVPEQVAQEVDTTSERRLA